MKSIQAIISAACVMCLAVQTNSQTATIPGGNYSTQNTNYYQVKILKKTDYDFKDLDWLRQRKIRESSVYTNAATRGITRITGRKDDLGWLVGRWKCVGRVPTSGATNRYVERYLDYFNVYLPYADKQLTLDLTDDPLDRPITAEIIVRVPKEGSLFEETIARWGGADPEVICIGTNRIWLCTFVDHFEMKYERPSLSSADILVLEIYGCRYSMQRVRSSTPMVEQLRASLVNVPVKNYTDEALRELSAKYEALKKGELSERR